MRRVLARGANERIGCLKRQREAGRIIVSVACGGALKEMKWKENARGADEMITQRRQFLKSFPDKDHDFNTMYDSSVLESWCWRLMLLALRL